MQPEHFEALYPDLTRFKEIEQIIKFIKEGNSCQTIGLSGVGRSNLLGLLSYNKNIRQKHLGENQNSFHFVLLNFSEVRKKTLSDTTKFMFLGLLDSLRERRMNEEYDAANQIFKESFEINDEMVIFQGLKKIIDYLCIEKNLTIVFLFDRFDEYVPNLTPEFFANLRILRNRAKYKFSVIFSLSRPLEELLEPIFFADFYEFVAGKIIYLQIFDKVGLDFRISYLEKITGKKINKKTIEKILELTGGHANLVKHCLEAILATDDINAELSARFFLNQKPIRSILFGIWENLNPSEQNMLNLLNFSNQDISYLENIELVKKDKLTIPLLRDYIKESSRIKSESEGKIIFNPDSNEIKKGEIVISDRLTSFEFKLLRFLILNKDKVVERNEIINAVWEDQRSTIGVTEQALDQLIFRLRKKIEDNPSSPLLLQTIKGRGIKLSY